MGDGLGRYQIYDKSGVKRKCNHREIWEDNNGKIPPGGVIHHINGNHYDNRIENLMLFKSSSDHTKYHSEQCGRSIYKRNEHISIRNRQKHKRFQKMQWNMVLHRRVLRSIKKPCGLDRACGMDG